MEAFSPSESTRILDVGGTAYNWTFVNCPSDITLLNIKIPKSESQLPANIHYEMGDGTNLRYGKGEFDICYSNSVIEHLFTFENQMKFAREVRRVGKQIWIQTPARGFFVEPHYITPFIHYFPKRIQRRLLRNFTLRGLVTRPKQEQIDGFLAEIRLINLAEMKELFPECEIYKEKFLFMTKAYIAIRK